jgi:hypothetical protein
MRLDALYHPVYQVHTYLICVLFYVIACSTDICSIVLCAKNFFHLHLHRTPQILFIAVVPNMAAYGCQLPQ